MGMADGAAWASAAGEPTGCGAADTAGGSAAGAAGGSEDGFLVLDGLTKRFGGETVIDGLSLSVAKGELVCLLGSSGCGKTTTLRMVGGFLKPDAGRVLVDGADVTAMPPEERPVSTVFQSYALFPHLDVLDNVAYGLKFRGLRRRQARARALEMLGRVGLADRADARIDEISGGQQQRVALARSLVLEPKVLLLDEPLSNLDAALRVRMRSEIKDIQRSFGVTMVFVTHDQEEAMAVGDRVALMREGRLRQVGAPEEVYSHPADEYCARFFGPVNEAWLDDGAGGREAVRFHPDDVRVREDGRGALRGVVRRCTFLGARRELVVELRGEGEGGAGEAGQGGAPRAAGASRAPGAPAAQAAQGAPRAGAAGGALAAPPGPPAQVTIRCDRAIRAREGDEVSFDVESRLEW